MSAAAVMGMRGRLELAAGGAGVPWEEGGKRPWVERALRRSAIEGCGGGGAAVIGVGVGLGGGRFGSRPLLAREAMRSAPFRVGAADAWVCTLLSCECDALWSAGAAARICGVLGFCPFAKSAWRPFSALGSRNGADGSDG